MLAGGKNGLDEIVDQVQQEHEGEQADADREHATQEGEVAREHEAEQKDIDRDHGATQADKDRKLTEKTTKAKAKAVPKGTKK